jgi:hypothetical protein
VRAPLDSEPCEHRQPLRWVAGDREGVRVLRPQTTSDRARRPRASAAGKERRPSRRGAAGGSTRYLIPLPPIVPQAGMLPTVQARIRPASHLNVRMVSSGCCRLQRTARRAPPFLRSSFWVLGTQRYAPAGQVRTTEGGRPGRRLTSASFSGRGTSCQVRDSPSVTGHHAPPHSEAVASVARRRRGPTRRMGHDAPSPVRAPSASCGASRAAAGAGC